jgi:hypothetical protein
MFPELNDPAFGVALLHSRVTQCYEHETGHKRPHVTHCVKL